MRIFLKGTVFQIIPHKILTEVKFGDVGGHDHLFSKRTGYRLDRTFLENTMKKLKYGIAGLRSGVILLKQTVFRSKL